MSAGILRLRDACFDINLSLDASGSMLALVVWKRGFYLLWERAR